jgi:hypothetical protein
MILKVHNISKVKDTISSNFFFYTSAFVISLQSDSLSLRVTHKVIKQMAYLRNEDRE